MRANDRGVWCLVVQLEDQGSEQGGEMVREVVTVGTVPVMEFPL